MGRRPGFATQGCVLPLTDVRAQAFGEWLQERRVARNPNRSAFARALGLNDVYLTRMEHGERMPGRLIVEVLARGLDLSPAEEDQLYLLAGYLPPSLELLPAWPPWLTTLCRSLASEELATS